MRRMVARVEEKPDRPAPLALAGVVAAVSRAVRSACSRTSSSNSTADAALAWERGAF